MHDMHVFGIDLNLLVLLRALLAEQSVTRAAKRVGLSQPATSHALKRLREHLGDPLFIRSGRELVPTPRALALREPIERALAGLERALASPRPFDPATARRSFTIGTTDYGQLVLLPRMLERLTSVGPTIDVRVRDHADRSLSDWLAEEGNDVIIGPLGSAAKPDVRHRKLFTERFVSLVRNGHPRVKGRLTLKTFASLRHAFVAPRGTRGGAVDDALRVRGLERRVALLIPHFLVAPQVIARSDLIVTLGERVARSFAEQLPLQVLSPPLSLPTFDVSLIWHAKMDADPAHAWLRDFIVGCAEGT